MTDIRAVDGAGWSGAGPHRDLPALDRAHGGNPRISGIDGLRAVAILLVMTAHAGLGHIMPGGFGVTVFFFLSGYLITTLLRIEQARSGRIHLGAFYARRAVRILPPLYLTLALVVALAAAGWITAPLSAPSLGLDLVFLTNYAGALGVQATTPIPLWSLDVEEHFYLAFPALFTVLAAPHPRRLVPVLAAVCVVVLAVRFATFPTAGRPDIYYWSHTRIDSIMFGALLAVWQNPVLDEGAWRPARGHVAIALGIVLLTFVVRSPLFRETVRYSLQGGALFVLFSAAIQARGVVARVLNGRTLRVVALLSYTLYLAHFPLLAATERLGAPWSVAIAYLLSFAWAAALYLLVERPLARWRKRSLRRASLATAG